MAVSTSKKEKPVVLDMYPCTPLQEGLMALSQDQPGAYILQNVYRLPADLDLPRFMAAWEKTVEATEILRTRIVQMDKKTVQVVLKQSLKWKESDCLQNYCKEDKETPVEYGKELSRFAIIGRRNPTGERYMVWTIHHAIYDGWSMSLMLDRVARVYSGQPLPKSVPFSRFIDHISQVDAGKSDDFWRSQLDGAKAPVFLDIPGGNDGDRRNRTLTYTVRYTRQDQSRITTSTLVRTAWALVISRYSDSDQAIFGATLTGRNALIKGIADLVGPTITTVPILIRIDRKRTVAQFLADVQSQSTSMIPFEHAGLQNIRRLGDDARSACSFRNLLVVQPKREADQEEFKVGSIGLQSVSTEQDDFHTYPLVLECEAGRDTIECKADFDECLIQVEQMQRIVALFEHVVHEIQDESDNRLVADISFFSQKDKELVMEWNGPTSQKRHLCIHEEVRYQARRRPTAEAVCGWDETLTYHELDTLAARLASRLVDLGIRPSTIVPLCFEKSTWAIVAMLAVLKAGGAVVSLDPSHPMGRVRDILTATAAKVLLSGSASSVKFTGFVQDVIVVNRKLFDVLPPAGTASYKNLADPGDPAFVIYTSGSTGTPKGVVLEHAALCTSIAAHGGALRVGRRSRVLQFAAYVFDISIHDIFTTLIHGGCVCVLSEQQRLNHLAVAINELKANTACLTPTIAGLLRPSEVPGLTTVILAGEAANKKVIDMWRGSVDVYNCYGPAECSIFCTWNDLAGETGLPSNIGRGLATHLWVVDTKDHDKLAPIGSAGELLLEGPLLARGYLKDESRTASSFIYDPPWARDAVNSSGKRRMYKTGDLVRYCEDGSLDFLGRKDGQVKIHGQRLELGEIEHHLNLESQIDRVMTMAPDKGHCQGRLVAVMSLRQLVPHTDEISKAEYSNSSSTSSSDHSALDLEPQFDPLYDTSSASTFDSSSETSLSESSDQKSPKLVTKENINELQLLDAGRMKFFSLQLAQIRGRLSAKVPAFMIPSVWIVVESVPLNNSGKLDRARIAEFVEGMSEETYQLVVAGEESEVTAPASAAERKLQEIIGHVLNLAPELVALNRSFVSLGGDSITAMQVVAGCRAENLTVKVKNVLQSRTLAELAQASTREETLPLPTEVEEQVFGLSPIQQMYFEMAGQKVNQFNQSFFLRFTRHVQSENLIQAIEIIIQQHSMLRARFGRDSDDLYKQSISKNIKASYNFRLHEATTQAEVMEVIKASQTSLDVENGPVFAADLINVGIHGQLLFLVAHHLVMDVVSWRVILQDLEEILRSGSLSTKKPFPFQAWCKLQAEYARNLTIQDLLPYKVTAADFAYWGMADRPNLYADAIGETFSFDPDTTALLLGKCNNALGTEPAEIFIAALYHSFWETFSGRAMPTMFSEQHGRHSGDLEIDLSRTVGWFTTMSPLHVADVGDDIVDVVRRTKDTRRKLPGNGWPYFIARFLNDEGMKAFRHHLPMEILFNYLGQYQQFEREDSLFRQASQEYGTDIGQDVERLALFEISVAVVQGSAQFSIVYNRTMKRRSDVLHWTRTWKNSLKQAAAALSQMEPQRTLDDFPLISSTYDSLDILKDQILDQIEIQNLSDVEDVYPCSPMQQGLLLSQSQSVGNYMNRFNFEVRPSLELKGVDTERLFAAWTQVIARHPMLRTVFMQSLSNENVYDQVVLKNIVPDTRRVACSDRDNVMKTLQEIDPVERMGVRPAHRLTVYETQDDEVYMQIQISHALIDASSLSTLLREMTAIYQGMSLPDKGPLYSRYLEYVKARPARQDKEYWKQYLADIEGTHIPTTRDDVEDRGQLQSYEFDLELSKDSLATFCSENNVTIANLMQTAWGLILRSYCSSDQVCFGYLGSGRDIDLEGVEQTVGPFISMLVCRLDLRDDSGISEVISKVQTDYLTGLEHQHYPLSQIQHDLGLSGTQLFNTIMSVQRVSPNDGSTPVLTFQSVGAHDPTEVGCEGKVTKS